MAELESYEEELTSDLLENVLPNISAVALVNEMLDNENESVDDLVSALTELHLEEVDEHLKHNYMEQLYSEHEKTFDDEPESGPTKYITRERIQVGLR